jgi:hypothetical protein
VIAQAGFGQEASIKGKEQRLDRQAMVLAKAPQNGPSKAP